MVNIFVVISLLSNVLTSTISYSATIAYAQSLPAIPAKIIQDENLSPDFLLSLSQSIVTNATKYNIEDPYTVLDIMYCESRFHNIKSAPNKDGTVDYGIMQINSTHIPEAKKMGLHIVTSTDDNIDFAFYLMSLQGTSPWRSSQWCWMKHPVSGGTPTNSE